MSDRSNIIYRYDGSYDGLLCCVFESYIHHEVPTDIIFDDTPQFSLYPIRDILTDPANAQRIALSIKNKLGKDAEYLIKVGFLCGLSQKSLIIFDFIRLGYEHGKSISYMLADTTVSQLQNMVKAVNNEKHLLLGFVRFSEYNGCLVAVIEPKHYVLPLMKGHFCARFSGEQFMIYDKTYNIALVYRPYEAKIIEVDKIDMPQASDMEEEYRRLWTGYYNAIAIKERENPRCRMSHMPKRFWSQLTEMNTDLSERAKRLEDGESAPQGDVLRRQIF